MQNFNKTLALCIAFVAISVCIFPAEASRPGFFGRLASCCSAPEISKRDLAHARAVESRVAALAKIDALQESAGVAPKKFVRLYSAVDFSQASAILGQNNYPDGYLEIKDYKVLVYEEQGKIKGVCAFMPESSDLSILSVGKEYQRNGIGSALVCATMLDLKKNCDARVIKVTSAEKALGFYKKLGFEFSGIEGRRALE